MNEYLITGRVKRELQTIQFLFEMQLGKDFNEAQNVFLMPGELAKEPRYILNFGFLLTKSDEMFDFATFKSQIVERVETAIDKNYLVKELNEIAEKCREIISLNEELSKSGKKKLTGSSKELKKIVEKHNAIVEIYNCDISIVYLGLSCSEYWDKDNKAFFPADNCFFLDYVDEVLAFINQLLTEQPETVKKEKLKKTLLDFIQNVKDKEAFVADLKKTFNTEKGKSIKAIINRLEEVEMITIVPGEFMQFYKELKTYFGRNIGEYSGINDPKDIDKKITDPIYSKLNPLINKHKSNLKQFV